MVALLGGEYEAAMTCFDATLAALPGEIAPKLALAATAELILQDWHTDDPEQWRAFAEKYYRMTYDTPDASPHARRIAALMPDTEPVHQHPRRGLDHGAWVPLKIMYPEADIPVIQMSLPTHDPYRLMALGARLAPLRDEGVLVIGSGFLTHGLPFLTEFRIDAKAPTWSVEFDAWAAEAMSRGDVEELASYRDRAPGMPYAHPTVEHYTPLFVTLGAATDLEAPGEQVIDGYWMGLSKRSLLVA